MWKTHLRKIHEWLMESGPSSLHPMKFLQNSIMFIVCIILFFTVFDLVDGLNSEPVLFLRLGSIFLLILLVVGYHFAKGVYIGTRHAFHGSPNLLKILFLLILLAIAIYAYKNQAEIKEFIEKQNKKNIVDKFNPFFLSTSTDSNVTVNSTGVKNTQKGLLEYINETKIPSTIQESFKEPSIDEIEQLTYQKINQLRGRQLKWNSKLGKIAREHSEDMVTRNFFDHENPSGLNIEDRAMKAGISYAIIGENISQMPTGNVEGCGSVYTAEEIATCAVDGWRNSPGHYANIMERRFSETGVGVAKSGSIYYLTQDFR